MVLQIYVSHLKVESLFDLRWYYSTLYLITSPVRLVSAGDDGYACLWTDGVADDSQMMHQLGDSVTSISVSDVIFLILELKMNN